MGTEIAQDLINETHQCAEQRLWRHVLVNAFSETKLPTSDRKSSIYKMQAHEWIIKDNQDFETICWWSGWDPETVRNQYLKAIRAGEITFNRKQVMWADYYKKYLKLKVANTNEERQNLRAGLEATRLAIFKATTALVSNFIIYQQS